MHPQTLAVVRTRAIPLGLEILIGEVFEMDFSNRDVSAVIFQYPDTNGNVHDFSKLVEQAQSYGVSLHFLGLLNESHPRIFQR